MTLQRYADWRPTQFDTSGLGADDKQNWLVAPCSTNRDADALTRSNFRVMCKALPETSDHDESDVELLRFGHWLCGWFEIVLIRPDSGAAKVAQLIKAKLENYPILNEEDFSNEESEESNETWRVCYSPKERIEYIRSRRSEFEFSSFADMVSCVRGKHFAGYASELLA